MELVESSPSGVVPGGVGMLMTAAVMYGWSQFRGTVSSNLAFRLDRLERLQKQRRPDWLRLNRRIFRLEMTTFTK